jgi:ABC-2 type transport system permease protein
LTSHLRLLLGLRFRLLLRQMFSRRARVISTIVLLVVITPLSIGLGWGAAWATRILLDTVSASEAHEWIHLIFLAVFVFLAISPVLGFRGSEFYDITKLFVFPVRQRTVFVAVGLGLMSSGTVLFLLPILVLPLLALPGGPELVLLRLAAVVVFLFLSVSIGQLLVYLLLGFLRSRRFHDLAAIIGSLIVAAVYLASRAVTFQGSDWLYDIVNMRPSRYLQAVPSYWVSLGAGAPSGPTLLQFLPLLLGALPLTVLVVALASTLQERAFFGQVHIATSRGKVRTRRSTALGRLLARILPGDVRAIMGKELRSLRREPMVKTLLIQQSAFCVIPLVVAMTGSFSNDGGDDVLRYLLLFPVVLLFVEMTLITNNLGLEGAGLVHLLITPVGRGRILLGKNLCHLAFFGVINTTLILAVALGAAAVVEGVTWSGALGAVVRAGFGGLLGLVAIIALGNLVSLYAPSRMTVKGRQALKHQPAGREGCVTAIIRIFAMFLAAVSLAPIAALLFLPDLIFGMGPWVHAISIPLAMLYVAGLLRASLRIGERIFSRRESRLLAFFAQSED